MTSINKIIKSAAALLCVLTLAACTGAPTEDTTTTKPEMITAQATVPVLEPDVKIGYIESDGIAPFETESALNTNLLELMYDSLFVLDSAFEPQACLAKSFEINGTKLTVNLKEGILFSDGSELTAADVSYSFSLAKKASAYKEALEFFSSVVYTDDYTLVFTLAYENPYAAACLTFPVIKSNSYESPVGTGRYTLTLYEGKKFLMANKNHTAEIRGEEQKNAALDIIELRDVGTAENLIYLVKSGEIDFTYDSLSSGKKISADTSCVPVQLGNMIFIGANPSSNFARYASVRRAVSAALDREKLVDETYGGTAKASYLPFVPGWYALNSYKYDNTATALEYLSEIGFGQLNDEGFATNGAYTVSLKMIVNSENPMRTLLAEKAAQQLMDSGINVNLIKYDFNEYKKAIESGEYDLYVGEIKITADMDLSKIMKNASDYGVYISESLRNSYESFLSGDIDAGEFAGDFASLYPFVPIAFRNGIAIFSRDLTGTDNICAGNLFAGIGLWHMSK